MPALRGRELAAFIVLSTLWSGNWLLIRVGLADLPPFLFAALRLVLASALLLAIVRGRRRDPLTGTQKRYVALAGLLQIGVSYACVFKALQWIDSGLAAVLFATFALWIGILAHFLLNEPLTRRVLGGALLGVAGVAVVQAPAVLSARPGGAAAGVFLMIVSSVVSAYAVILVKKHLHGVPALTHTLGQSVMGGGFLLVGAAVFERSLPARFTPGALGALAYLGVVGTLVFAGSQWLVPRVSAAVMGAFPLVNSALALVWGSLLGHEALTARGALGGALILTGVALVAFGPSPQRVPQSGG